MKHLHHICLSVFILASFTGCFLDDDNSIHPTTQTESNVSQENNDENENTEETETDNEQSNTTQTQFAADLQTVLSQNEDDEPLEITDTSDDSSNFDALL